jgi:uncharacterized membrane protein YqgA involved in biofilm formation
MFMAIAGFVRESLVISNDTISTQGTNMLIFSMVAGALVGEALNIDKRLNQFGSWLKMKTGNAKDNRFIDGFVTASLTVCIGAMAVIGSITDGILGDWSILATKSILDAIIIAIMASAYGKGCIFSCIPVFLFQGSITLLAKLLEPIMTAPALSNLSLVGSVLIFCIGINIAFKKHIKVSNLLPAIFFSVIAIYLPML